MQRIRIDHFFMMFVLVTSLSGLGVVQAEEGRWTAGFNTGLSILTQEALNGTDGSIGPVVNVQVSYGISSVLSAGFLFEWEHRSFDTEGGTDSGDLNTFSLMPIAIWHFGSYNSVFPYLSTGIGFNINSFDEESGILDTDIDTTFAWRLAGGANYPLEMVTENLFLNGEIAWKRNRGGVEVGNSNGNFDGSSLNFLVGLRYTF